MNDEKALQLGKQLLPTMKALSSAAKGINAGILLTAMENGSVMATVFGTTLVISKNTDQESYRMERSSASWYTHLITEDLEGEADVYELDK